MKKFSIILAVILISGLTAFSLTRNEKKAEVAKMTNEKAAIEITHTSNTTGLATAD